MQPGEHDVVTVHDSRCGDEMDSTPLSHGLDGEPIEPCEYCATPIVLVAGDRSLPRHWAEYHGELAPGEHYYFTHGRQTCRNRREDGDPLMVTDPMTGDLRSMTDAEAEALQNWARSVADPAKREQSADPDDVDRLRARIDALRDQERE